MSEFTSHAKHCLIKYTFKEKGDCAMDQIILGHLILSIECMVKINFLM
jgi:hypothetical protein